MSPTILAKAAGIACTVAALGAAIAIGGGVPPSPARIADAASDAARNAGVAARNTEETARRTRALASIARNVRSQHRTSQRMLSIQLDIEVASRAASEKAHTLADRIAAIERAVDGLASRLRELESTSSAAGEASDANAEVAVQLTQRLQELSALFAEVTDESRELNRKARAYARARGDEG